MTKSEIALIEAYNRGYRIDQNGNMINPEGKFVNGSIHNKYKAITLRIENYFYKIRFHRLQAYQKFGDKIFEEGIMIRHLDDDKMNNSKDNIEIGTNKDNQLDVPLELRVERAKYASSFLIKYNKDEIKEFYNSCKSYKQTMEKFDISSKGTLNAILKR